MGIFRKAKEQYEVLKLAKAKLDYINQFDYLPDVSKCDVEGDWILFRDSAGNTCWYVTEGEKPLYVEERVPGAAGDTFAFICTYYTDEKGNSDERYMIARGTNDGLDT